MNYQLKRLNDNKAQNMVEYLLLFGIVVVFGLFFLNTNGGPFSTALKSTVDTSITDMVNMTDTILNP